MTSPVRLCTNARTSVQVAALGLLLLAPALALAAWPPDLQEAFRTQDLIYVATQRKGGARSTPAPVWFAEMDGAVWINTGADSHKVERLKRGSPMFIAAKEEGPYYEVNAQIVKDRAIVDRLAQLYKQRYWIAWLGFFRPNADRVDAGKTVIVKLTPKDGGT